MDKDIGAFAVQVETELFPLLAVVALNEPVASTDAVTAEHDQVSTNIVPGMLADVVEGQADPEKARLESEAPTERAVPPFTMEPLEQGPIANDRFGLCVYGYLVTAGTPNRAPIQ